MLLLVSLMWKDLLGQTWANFLTKVVGLIRCDKSKSFSTLILVEAGGLSGLYFGGSL